MFLLWCSYVLYEIMMFSEINAIHFPAQSRQWYFLLVTNLFRAVMTDQSRLVPLKEISSRGSQLIILNSKNFV